MCTRNDIALKVLPGNQLSLSSEVTGSDGCVGYIERVQFSLHRNSSQYILYMYYHHIYMYIYATIF